ncbi:hypothetical protein TVAGG3_0365570, partial [Trichomonas vaginalis G3]|uniref:hypothetical protein n=1 Tax=Trichomonas vaginalis (strain ATCC PRA-98 / G3) TaxID=412133 RepID=UPI0021E5DFBB
MSEKTQSAVPLIEIKKGRPETLMSESSRRTNASISRVRVSKMDNKKASSLLMEGKSLNTVGFKKGGIQTQADLTHFRNIVVSKVFPEKAMNLLKNLEESISQIPINSYGQASPEEKFEILNQLCDAYNFAWNEGCIQLKEISDEHGKLFAKIKLFYMSLLEKYPKLSESYNDEIHKLRDMISLKDENIKVIEKELKNHYNRAESAKKFITDVQNEATTQRTKKRQYREQANERSVQIEQLKSLETELRLQITILKEENDRLKVQKTVPNIKDTSNYVDIGTDPIEIPPPKIRESQSSIFTRSGGNFISRSSSKRKITRV